MPTGITPPSSRPAPRTAVDIQQQNNNRGSALDQTLSKAHRTQTSDRSR